MNQTLLILICVGVGLCLGQRMRTQAAGTLPRPSLRAENGSLVPQGGAVTFQCRGSEKAEFYRLEKMEGSERKGIKDVLKAEIEVEFSLSSVTWSHAGIYYCRYFHSTCWSESSNPLELVVTDNPKGPQIPGNIQSLTSSLPKISSPSPGNDSLDANNRDYTVGNLVRLILAGLVLIILAALLIEYWHSLRGQKTHPKEPMPEHSGHTRPKGTGEEKNE